MPFAIVVRVVLFILICMCADAWWEVGFHFIAAVNNAFILGYPALIMAYLGWAMGSICLIGGGIISFYNNCLLGSLHETGGKRHIYGKGMYRATWFVQYFNLSIANIGTIILAGEALKVPSFLPSFLSFPSLPSSKSFHVLCSSENSITSAAGICFEFWCHSLGSLYIGLL